MGRPTIAIDDLLKQMLEAAKIVLKTQWKQVKPMAELQLRSTLINLELIAELKLRGKITKEQAALHIEIQKQSIRTTLLSFEGIGIVAAEKALNAAHIFPRRYFYPSLNTVPFVAKKDMNIAESISNRILCLPISHNLENDTLRQIVKIINTIC